MILFLTFIVILATLVTGLNPVELWTSMEKMRRLRPVAAAWRAKARSNIRAGMT